MEKLRFFFFGSRRSKDLIKNCREATKLAVAGVLRRATSIQP